MLDNFQQSLEDPAEFLSQYKFECQTQYTDSMINNDFDAKLCLLIDKESRQCTKHMHSIQQELIYALENFNKKLNTQKKEILNLKLEKDYLEKRLSLQHERITDYETKLNNINSEKIKGKIEDQGLSTYSLIKNAKQLFEISPLDNRVEKKEKTLNRLNFIWYLQDFTKID